MSRLLIPAVIVLIVIVGGLFLLGGRARERPQTHVERAVSLANLQN